MDYLVKNAKSFSRLNSLRLHHQLYAASYRVQATTRNMMPQDSLRLSEQYGGLKPSLENVRGALTHAIHTVLRGYREWSAEAIHVCSSIGKSFGSSQ